ncbi:MAG: tRNA pseudouridine32 synthase/23S rRNA pseudouridine746 synthase [Candidatus Azotimanducaceae bacterium]|jgi:tRNA pseudouridine32 synthase/23S rRNA pseudouridine746 synthase
MLTTSPETFNLDITDPEASIPDLLSELTGLSRTRIKHAMTCGAVWRKTGETQQRVRRANVRVKAGDKIVFNHSPEALDSVSLTPELIFDGTDFSVWFKPAGMTVSGIVWIALQLDSSSWHIVNPPLLIYPSSLVFAK